MPASFLKCVAEGGKVVTKKLPGGKYIHLCKSKSGRWFAGEVKKRKKKRRRKKNG